MSYPNAVPPPASFRAVRLRAGEARPADLRHLILSAARDLPRRIPTPARRLAGSLRPRSFTRLGLTAFAAALLGLGSAASVATAQSQQPWYGPGIPAPQFAVVDTARPAQSHSATAGARAVALVGLTVSDMDGAVAFYTRVLDFVTVSDQVLTGAAYDTLQVVPGTRLRVVKLRLGDESLQLTEYLTPKGRPVPADSRSNDRWFQHVAIIVSDMDRAYARLRQFRVRPASTSPQLLPKSIPNAAGIRAFYFRDPDGHFLEILQFPPDKGDPRWQRGNGRLFLGIDHTAIVVGQTGASLRFYRDLLGFRVAGESMNSGTEQEHLNNVKGARLHITGLRVGDGPGIEFLEYLVPRDGRAFPADERANDLVHWQTTIVVPNVDSAAGLLRRGNFRLLSPQPVELPDTALGFRRGILARDPDGHVVQLVER